MINKFILLISLAGLLLQAQTGYEDLFSTPSSNRESGTANGDNGAEKKTRPVVLSGLAECRYLLPLGKSRPYFSDYPLAPGMRNELSLEGRFQKVNLRLGVESRLYLARDLGRDNFIKFRPMENYIKYSPGKASISFGYQVFSWGSADGQNPTDTLNPRDYREGPGADKIPVLSMHLDFYPISRLGLEGVLIPVAGETELPFNLQERIPGALFHETRITAIAGTSPLDAVPAAFSNKVRPKVTSERGVPMRPSSFTAGARLRYFSRKFDLSLSYHFDMDPLQTPLLQLEAYSVLSPDAVLSGIPTNFTNAVWQTYSAMESYRVAKCSLYRGRLHRIGMDFKTEISRAGLWLEAGYSFGPNSFSENNYKFRKSALDWVLGCDLSYGSTDQHYFNLQHIGKFIPGYYNSFYTDYQDGLPDFSRATNQDYMEEFYYRALTDKLGLQTEGLLLGLACNFKWSIGNDLFMPELTFLTFFPLLYDKEEHERPLEFAVTPCITLKPTDNLEIILEGKIYMAPVKKDGEYENDDESRLGSFHEQNRIGLMVKYIFATE